MKKLFFALFFVFGLFAVVLAQQTGQAGTGVATVPTVSGAVIASSGLKIDLENKTITTGTTRANLSGTLAIPSVASGMLSAQTGTGISGVVGEDLGNGVIKLPSGALLDKNTGRIIGATMQTSTTTTATGDASQATNVYLSGADELENAILWMYTNGLTMFQTKESFRINENITREQMSKMMVQVYKALGIQGTGATGCAFTDIITTDPTLRDFVVKSCQLGLLKGWDGKFHPQTPLTKAQTLTLLIRMLGGEQNQNVIPRWQYYATQAQAVGLIADIDAKIMDKSITRGDVAMLIYRAKSISENKTLMSQARQAMQSSVDTQTQKVDTDLLNDSMSLLTEGITASDDPELREAVFRMYQQQMTEYNDVEKFRAFDQITRQEAAKLIGQFHQKFFKTGAISTAVLPACVFKDIGTAAKDLQAYITYVCTEGMLRGQNGYFSPTHPLAKSEFVAAIIRMLGKDLSTTGKVWRQPYFDMGMQLGLVGYLDKIAFVKNYPATRYEVALILYRFWIKYKFLSSLNGNAVENQVISMVENSQVTLAGEKQGKIYITTTKFADQDFKIGYIELFDKKYKIVKDKVDTYFGNGFVRYGYVYDLSTDKPVGTMRLSVLNTTVLDGNIKPELSGTAYYEITKPDETNSYYIIKEKSGK